MAVAEVQQPVAGISRREFLYYIWGASIALYTAEFLGLIIWFAIPRIKEGEFGGIIPVPVDKIPPVNDPPENFSEGRFWLVNLDSTQSNDLMYQASDEQAPIRGLAAIYKVCTHLGCIYSWNAATNRFECPCHGSKYRLDGRRIESPAPRTLDRFEVQVTLSNGDTLVSTTDESLGFFAPLPLPDGAEIVDLKIDTGNKKPGPTQPLLSELVS